MDSGQNTERQNQKRKVKERCKASNNDEGGREETSRTAQTEVDGQSAEGYERTPARPKARTEQRRLDKCSHGDRPRKGIRSSKVSIYVKHPATESNSEKCSKTIIYSTAQDNAVIYCKLANIHVFTSIL